MKILVTGANGYIGSHVVKCLLDNNIDVIACDINTSNVDKRATCINIDIFNSQNINMYKELHSPDVCLHMAWRNGFVHNSESHMIDLSLHYQFLTKIIDGGLKHLAIMGTMHEVGYWVGAIDESTPCNPSSLYGIAKDALRRAIMLYASQKNCLLQWIRCYYIIGDDLKSNSIFGKIIKAANNNQKSFPLNSGKNKYDFIKIEQLAEQISATIMQDEVFGVINCCSGMPVSLGEQVESFIREHNLNLSLIYGAFPDRPYDSPCIYGDDSKIKYILNQRKYK